MTVFCLFGWADTVKSSKYDTVTTWDYRKLGRFVRGEWPKPLGDRMELGESDIPAGLEPSPYKVYDPRGIL